MQKIAVSRKQESSSLLSLLVLDDLMMGKNGMVRA